MPWANSRDRGGRCGGFSLVELLIVIGVLAVLLAIAVPVLSSARSAARRAACETQIRTCMQAISVYTTDYDDAYPMFAERRVENAFTNGGYSLDYYLQSIHWPMAARTYLSDSPLEKTQICVSSPVREWAFTGGNYESYLAQYPPSYTQPSEYRMSYAMITAPEMWAEGGRLGDEQLLRAVRVPEVRFASAKGVLVEARPFHAVRDWETAPSLIDGSGAEGPYPIAFADGSVSPHRRSALEPGFDGNGIWPEFAAPVLATRDGAHGRDR